jgi:hypothetical protein
MAITETIIAITAHSCSGEVMDFTIAKQKSNGAIEKTVGRSVVGIASLHIFHE